MSCFHEATLVQTMHGPRPIKDLLPGDRVLVQDVHSAELHYLPLRRRTLSPSTRLWKIKAGDEQIATTAGHPFWISGKGWQVAQHIAAMSPLYLSREDVPEDTVANERRIAEETAREEGKPEQALPKIVEGRVNGFFKDVCLLEQPWIMDDKTTVKAVLEAVADIEALAPDLVFLDIRMPGRTGLDAAPEIGEQARVVFVTAYEQHALAAFEAGPWGQRYPAIGQSWRRAWAEVIPFFAFPDEVRRIVYTTNAIEALNSKLRRAVRARGHFPSDDAATKLLYLILNRSEKEWKMPPREWSMAKAQFAVIFGERFIRAMAA